MGRPQLRIYRGPEQDVVPQVEQLVRVRLGDVYPLMHDAVQTNLAWMQDFDDDEIHIPADLYECLRAYQRWRPSA